MHKTLELDHRKVAFNGWSLRNTYGINIANDKFPMNTTANTCHECLKRYRGIHKWHDCHNCFQDWTADDFAPYCWWKGAGTETRTVYIKGGWYLLHHFGLWLGNTCSILQGRPSWRTWNCWCLLMEDVGFVPHFHSLWRWRCRVSVVDLSHLCWYVILAPIFTVMSLSGCSSCCRRW